MESVWKVCLEDSNYSVSNKGDVYSHRNKIILKPTKRPDGYLQVFLSRKPHYVHRLVGSNFLNNNKDLRQINHKDKNQDNNYVENLEWCDNSHNQRHKHYGTRRGVSFHKGNSKWRVSFLNKHIAYVDNKEDGYLIFHTIYSMFYNKQPW